MKPSQLIFYLDDDADDLYFFRNAAESLGHKVTTFIDGHDMLQELKKDKEKPDVIFLDVHMPILNGQEILDLLKKSPEWQHIPIVMISGAYPKKLVRHFIEAGANYLMKKPVVGELKKTLAQVLAINWQDYKASA